MAELLFINACSKERESSHTLYIAAEFLTTYHKTHLEDEITVLSLYKEDLNFLTEYDVKRRMAVDTDNQLSSYAHQFKQADKVVIAAPMWNFTVPAILKAYIDYISIPGLLFEYTSTGINGLCNHKPALYITTTGGYYNEEPFSQYEFNAKYMKAMLESFDCKVQIVYAQGLDVYGVDAEKELDLVAGVAKKIAKQF